MQRPWDRNRADMFKNKEAHGLEERGSLGNATGDAIRKVSKSKFPKDLVR